MIKIIDNLLAIPKVPNGVLYALVGLTYISAIIVVRWHLIAVPLRQHLRVAIKSVRARLKVETRGSLPESENSAGEQIEQLLSDAEKQLDTSLWDRIFWSRGREMNGWRYVHEAGRLMAVLYHPQMVNTRLRGAVSELRQITSREATDLANDIEKELGPKAEGDIKARRALLQGALAFIYDHRDNKYNELDTWDNEAVWMITSGLLLMAALGYTLGNSALFFAGAAGGFLGRLTRLFKVKFESTDYGLYWDSLFMSPVLGALAGWTGVLLITFMAGDGIDILGSAFKVVSWSNPYHPYALALAFLFGLSERFFGSIVSGAESKVINLNADESKKLTVQIEHGVQNG